MAKKDNKTKIQKPEAALQTDAAQITATGRVIAEHPSNFITPQKMRASSRTQKAATSAPNTSFSRTLRSATATSRQIWVRANARC